MNHRLFSLVSLCVGLTLLLSSTAGGMSAAAQGGGTPRPSGANETTRVSISSDGTQGNMDSWYPAVSGDGRYVALWSAASNLVPGDTNGELDVFVHDRQTGQTERVSVASDGTQGNGYSSEPAISADGRFAAFHSAATNLVPGDSNDRIDVFVHDRQTGQTERISVASDGTEGNGGSVSPALSGDGRYVAFASSANNLVAGDTNDEEDVFVRDRQTAQTVRVSVASDGTQGSDTSYLPTISADGRYVGFVSYASNLVPGDTNGDSDAFVHDQQTGQTVRVSVASDGTQGNGVVWDPPSLSATGRYVAFRSNSELVPGDTNDTDDVFVHDLQTGQTGRVSVASDGTQGNGPSDWPAISADGRYVAFYSFADNLAPGDTNGTYDIFIHDRHLGQTERVSIASDGTQANDPSYHSALSADGRYVVFDSMANNLVPGDTNGCADIFVHEREEIPLFQIYLPLILRQSP